MESADHSISTVNLLEWALQIVQGMQHLESREIVHSDLAARNILLDDRKVVKICDFGLARSVYKSGIYRKKGEVKIDFSLYFNALFSVFITPSILSNQTNRILCRSNGWLLNRSFIKFSQQNLMFGLLEWFCGNYFLLEKNHFLAFNTMNILPMI